MRLKRGPFSPGTQQLQHLAIELVTPEIVIGDILTAAVEYAEASAKIPQCPAPAGFLPQLQAVAHPGQYDSVRRMLMGAPFAHMNADAFPRQCLPRCDAHLL